MTCILDCVSMLVNKSLKLEELAEYDESPGLRIDAGQRESQVGESCQEIVSNLINPGH